MKNNLKDSDVHSENKRTIGEKNEYLAEKWLINRGFDILYRNYYRNVGEIDIIAKKLDKIHFIEIKSVSYNTFDKILIKPEDHVTHEKLVNIYNTAELFLTEYNLEGCSCQVDLIAIVSEKNKIISLEYFPSI